MVRRKTERNLLIIKVKNKRMEEPLSVDSFFVPHRQGSGKWKSGAAHFRPTFSVAEPGGGESVIFRFPSPGTIPIPSGECVKVGVAAVAIAGAAPVIHAAIQLFDQKISLG